MSLDDNIWQRLVNAENEYEQAKWYFFKHCSDVLGTLRKALHIPYRRGTTLRLIKHLNIEDHKALLHDLVEEASIGHSDIQLVRDVILSLPNEWLREHIEAPIQKVLSNGGEEEYRRLIELCISIDSNLVERLSKQALAHSNEDIKEVGGDYPVSNCYSSEVRAVLVKLIELIDTKGNLDEFYELLEFELPYLCWGRH